MPYRRTSLLNNWRRRKVAGQPRNAYVSELKNNAVHIYARLKILGSGAMEEEVSCYKPTKWLNTITQKKVTMTNQFVIFPFVKNVHYNL